MNILLNNTVRVLWALYVRIQLHTYRAPIGAIFVPYRGIQLPGSCIRRYCADDLHIKLPGSCMRRYGAYDNKCLFPNEFCSVYFKQKKSIGDIIVHNPLYSE